MGVDARSGTQQSLDKGFAGHLEAEEADRGGVATVALGAPGRAPPERDLLGEVERQGGLAHRGACGEDDHLAGLHAAQHLVQVRKAGRDADGALALGLHLDADDLVSQEFREFLGALGFRLAGDLEDHLFGGIEDVGPAVVARLVSGVERHVHDLARGRYQPAESAPVGDDPGVMLGVPGAGHGLGERDEEIGIARVDDLA